MVIADHMNDLLGHKLYTQHKFQSLNWDMKRKFIPSLTKLTEMSQKHIPYFHLSIQVTKQHSIYIKNQKYWNITYITFPTFTLCLLDRKKFLYILWMKPRRKTEAESNYNFLRWRSPPYSKLYMSWKLIIKLAEHNTDH